jgi:hypothetical protein
MRYGQCRYGKVEDEASVKFRDYTQLSSPSFGKTSVRARQRTARSGLCDTPGLTTF